MAQRRAYHRRVVTSLRRRRQQATKLSIVWAWKGLSTATSAYLSSLDTRYWTSRSRQALALWRCTAATQKESAGRMGLASTTHASTQKLSVLRRWVRSAGCSALARHYQTRAENQHRDVAVRRRLLGWRRLGKWLRRSRQLGRCAERHWREAGMRRALGQWEQASRFNAAFRAASCRALARRILLRWRREAAREADLRAFRMALSTRQEIFIQHTAFHALSLYAVRRARLRRCEGLTALMVEQNTLHTTLRIWAHGAIIRRRDLTLGIKVGVAHFMALMRASLKDWRALMILRREGRLREGRVLRQALWAWVVRVASSRDQRRAITWAEQKYLRSVRTRAIRSWREVGYAQQYARLQVRCS